MFYYYLYGSNEITNFKVFFIRSAPIDHFYTFFLIFFNTLFFRLTNIRKKTINFHIFIKFFCVHSNYNDILLNRHQSIINLINIVFYNIHILCCMYRINKLMGKRLNRYSTFSFVLFILCFLLRFFSKTILFTIWSPHTIYS